MVLCTHTHTCACVCGGGGAPNDIDSVAPMHNLQCTRRVSRNPFHCSLANTPGTDPVGAAPPRVGRRAGPLALGPERKPDRCLSRPHHQLEAIYHRQGRSSLRSMAIYNMLASTPQDSIYACTLTSAIFLFRHSGDSTRRPSSSLY